MLYNETVLITGVRANGRRVYAADLPCRYVDDGVSDGVTDAMLVAGVDMATFFVDAKEWPDAKPPQAGDVITRETGEIYKAGRVTRLADCYCINARSR